MTTIAFDGKTIAYDSRVTQGDAIITDAFDKHAARNGVHFFLSGQTSDYDAIIEAFLSGTAPSNCEGRSVTALVWDGSYASECSLTAEAGYWQERLLATPAAYGSGRPHALTAMDMGADAVTAVKMAAKRDTNTGGKIRTFKLTEKQSK